MVCKWRLNSVVSSIERKWSQGMVGGHNREFKDFIEDLGLIDNLIFGLKPPGLVGKITL